MVTTCEDGLSRLVCPPENTICRRQDTPPVFDMTTVAYVADPDFILKRNAIFEGRVKSVLVPPKRAMDIDTPLDLKVAELLLSERTTDMGDTND
ncbi:hypothetical protein [Salidesulfovibrio brasiliensis]|uniref:hypothetical protein n=1 Tax=Salidesulfovibrio brasiliensis TaxID=221711 RepID=UPI0006D0F9A3|nr:hypothetical protein [Salidesulfovibrio brasiliensis]